MPGGRALARAAGVKPEVIDDVFAAIVRLTRDGARVSLRGFGAFWAGIHPGRTQITPLVEGGSVTYGDRVIMKFKPSTALKQRMNRPRKESRKKHGKRRK
jgi:nucleoid DNA-binding protein